MNIRGVTFVPPPGWSPAPANWLPDATWSPDPSWPTPPDGWVFYRGPYGEPIDAPSGAWPGTPRQYSSPAPGAAPFVPAPTPGSPEKATSGRRPRGLWLALGGATLVIVAALAVALNMLHLASDPDLSDRQLDVLMSDPALNAFHLDLVKGASTQLERPEHCSALTDIEKQHMLKHYSNTRPTDQALPTQTVFVGVFDSPNSAKEHFALVGPCNAELGSRIIQPATSGSKGQVMVAQQEGESESLVMAQYANILVTAPQSFAGDPMSYLSVLVGAVERAAAS